MLRKNVNCLTRKGAVLGMGSRKVLWRNYRIRHTCFSEKSAQLGRGIMNLLQVLQHTKEINRKIDIVRLKRIHEIYRTWINVQGIDGGFGLTRDEFECILEYPNKAFQEEVEFMFDFFKTKEMQRVDLITFLSTNSFLCNGTLEQKCQFLFQLVDHDIEDEIVEEELAVIISSISDGLLRLGLVSNEMEELDALAIAEEAFDFCEVEEGGKLNFGLFFKWCMFHPRPQAIMDRIRCKDNRTRYCLLIKSNAYIIF
jgi:Ca2+-binding EF-hand superfamily protein